jgi:hypothetical protein
LIKSIITCRQAIAEKIYLRYLQRWAKDYIRRRLHWQVNSDDTEATSFPRHLRMAYCPCQYVEEVLKSKIPKVTEESSSCWSTCNGHCSKLGFKLC